MCIYNHTCILILLGVSHYLYGSGLCLLYAFQQYTYSNTMYTMLESITNINNVNITDANTVQASPTLTILDTTNGHTTITNTNNNTNVINTNTNSSTRMKCLINTLITVSSVVHAMVISAAAIDFPKGVIVGLVYVIIGMCVSVYTLVQHKQYEGTVASLQDILRNGHQVPITWYFTQGFLYSLCILIAWCCVYGVKSRDQAGVV